MVRLSPQGRHRFAHPKGLDVERSVPPSQIPYVLRIYLCLSRGRQACRLASLISDETIIVPLNCDSFDIGFICYKRISNQRSRHSIRRYIFPCRATKRHSDVANSVGILLDVWSDSFCRRLFSKNHKKEQADVIFYKNPSYASQKGGVAY